MLSKLTRVAAGLQSSLPHAGVCFAAGCLATLAFPPQNWGWLSVPAVVPWLRALEGATVRQAAARSCAFGFGFCALGAWIPETAQRFGADWAGAYGLWAITAASYVPAIAALGVALRATRISSAWFPLMAGTGWGIVELSYGTVWPGIPYIVLGSTLIETPLVALGRLIGVHGVSALVVWCAAAVYQSVRCGSVPLATWAGGLVLLSVMLAFPRVAPLDTTTRDLHVAAVQAAVAMRSPLDSSIAQRNFDALVALSRQLPLVALIIWPENSLMATLEGRPDLATRASDLASELRTPLWAGVHRRVGAAQANSVALFSPGSKPVVIYDKVRLLPLAEAVPAWLPAPARRALGRFVSADPFVRGAISRRTLPAAAISICFESAFSGEQQDPHAEMLVNVVNDGWYDRSHAPEHLLLLARWRAIESAAPMVRAAATGISAFIDAEGRIRDSLGLGRAGTIVGVVATSSAVTPFERAGYWPLALAAAVSWVGGLIGSQEGARRVFRR